MQANKSSGLSTLALVALLVGSGLAAMPLAVSPATAAPLGAPTCAAVAGVPTVSEAHFKDNDANGHLDEVDLLFSECMQAATFRPRDWQVFGSVQATGGFVIGAPTNSNQARLFFPEQLDFDAGPLSSGGSFNPGLSYTLSDSNFPFLDTDTPTAQKLTSGSTSSKFDEASPIWKATYATGAGGACSGTPSPCKVVVSFSEAVGTGTGTTAPVLADFCIGATNPTAISAGPARTYVLTFAAAVAVPSTVTNCGAALKDSSGNALVIAPAASPAPAGNIAGRPIVKTIYASEGDSTVVVEFNGAVSADGSTGTAWGGFTAVTGTGSGGSCGATSTPGVYSGSPLSFASATQPSDRVRLTANAPLNCGDMAATLVHLSSTNYYGYEGSAASPIQGTAGDYALKDSGFVAAPRVLSVKALDTTGNGCDDAVELTWNENMKDTSVSSSTAGWSVVLAGMTGGSPGALTFHTGAAANDQLTRFTFLGSDSGFGGATCFSTDGLPTVAFAPGTAPTDWSSTPNSMLTGISAGPTTYSTLVALKGTDGAIPRIGAALTQDTGTPDGKLDQIRLTFSEPIDDASFDYQDWSATMTAAALTASNVCPLATGTVYTITGQVTGTANDNVMSLSFGSASQPDTSCKPELTYLGGAHGKFVRDLSSTTGTSPPDQRLPNISSGSVFAADGAGPVLTSITGVVGSNVATLVFSEPVRGAGSGNVVRPVDLNYNNNNGAGVSGINCVQSVPSATTCPGTVPTGNDARLQVILNGGAAGLLSSDATGSTKDCLNANNDPDPDGAGPLLPAFVKDNAGNLAYPLNGAGVRPCVYFTIGASPVISSAITVDSDHDGSLDAVQLTFSASLNDNFGISGACGTAAVAACPWAVTFPTGNARVTDVVTGQGTTGTATGGSATTVVDTSADFSATGHKVAAGWILTVTGAGAGTYTVASATATTITFSPAAGTPVASGSSYILAPPAATHTSGGTTCHDSAGMAPSITRDQVLYVCFNELVDAQGNLVPNTGSVPSVTYTGSTLADASSGVLVGTFTNQASTDGAAPVLVKVTGGPGSDIVVALFSEPVAEVSSGGNLKASDFVYSNANNGAVPCVSGASNIIDVPTYPTPTGSAAIPVTMKLNGKLSFDDINTAAGSLWANCLSTGSGMPPWPAAIVDGVRANSGLVQSLCKCEPTVSGSSLFTGPGVYNPSSPVRIVDTTAPTILRSGFIDAPGMCCTPTFTNNLGADGIIDAVQVRFSEYIDDSALNLADWAVKIGTQSVTIKAIVSASGITASCNDGHGNSLLLNPDEQTAPAVGTAAGGAKDDVIFLCLENTKTLANGGTLDQGTGVTGTVVYTAPLVSVQDRASPANKLASTSASGLSIVDLARPVVLNTCRPVSTTCADKSPETWDRNHNGKIDAMKLFFSEKVKDSTWKANEWDIAGRTILGNDTAGTGAPVSPTSPAVNDDQFWIAFAEGSAPDTSTGRAGAATIPDVSFIASGSMTDLAGNKVRGVSAGSCTAGTSFYCADERDGAQPVVTDVQASAASGGSDLVTVGFSEPVDGTGSGGRIASGDIAYQNNNPSTSGATGIVNIFHNAGDQVLTVQLDRKVTASDVSADKFVFVPGNIKEHFCGTPPGSCYRQLPLFQTIVPLSGVADAQPPAAITDLKIKDAAADITTTSVRLTWTAPSDLDMAGYQVYYCTCAIGTTVPTGAVQFTGTLPTPAANTEQSVNVNSGLMTGVQYNFTVIALDSSGNLAPLSNVVSAKPQAPDTTAPGLTTPTRDSVTATSVTVSWTAPGDDGTTGTVAGYKVAVSTSPILTQSDFTTKVTTAVSFSPATLVAAGLQQRATITGLTTGVPVYIAVEAYDDAAVPNQAGLGGTAQATPAAGVVDTVPPGTINDLAASLGTPNYSTVELVWSAPGNNGPVGAVDGYDVYVSTSPFTSTAGISTASSVTFTPIAPTGPGNEQHATVSGLDGSTTYYFAVVAYDNGGNTGGISNVVSLATVADPNAASAADIAAASAALTDSAKVTNEGDTNTITFTVPTSATHTVAAIQVWRQNDDGSFELLRTIYPSDPEFTSGTFVDSNFPAKSDKYKLTVAYGNSCAQGLVTTDAEQADPSQCQTGFASLDTVSAAGSNTLLWILIGAGALLLIVLAVVFILLRRRGKEPEVAEGEAAAEGEAPAEGDAWGEAPPAEGEAPADAWADAPAEAPAEPEAAAMAAPAAAQVAMAESKPAPNPTTHYITCPRCSSEFTAKGVKPLAIQCPSCGVRGMLR